MAGFTWVKSLDGSVPQKFTLTIKNSTTVYKGSFGIFSSGFVSPATAGGRIALFIENLVTKNGYPLEEAESSEYDGTFTAGAEGVSNYASSADNQTDKQIKILGFIPRPGIDIFSSAPDATIGTSTGSNLNGYYSDLVDSISVDESSAHETTASQLTIHGVDPNNSANGLYSVAESFFIR